MLILRTPVQSVGPGPKSTDKAIIVRAVNDFDARFKFEEHLRPGMFWSSDSGTVLLDLIVAATECHVGLQGIVELIRFEASEA